MLKATFEISGITQLPLLAVGSPGIYLNILYIFDSCLSCLLVSEYDSVVFVFQHLNLILISVCLRPTIIICYFTPLIDRLSKYIHSLPGYVLETYKIFPVKSPHSRLLYALQLLGSEWYIL